MIASVVATTDADTCCVRQIVEQIRRLPGVEVGDLSNPRRIPITVDSPRPRALEEATNAIQRCEGVVFVDVVFVHFEDEPPEPPATIQSGPDTQ